MCVYFYIDYFLLFFFFFYFFFFFFNDTATTEIYTLSLHDALPISRLANDTSTDTFTQLPLSSRHVAECLRRGAERFGWSRRSMAPGSMRANDGSLIGWGVAIGAYPASVVAEIVRLTVLADGDVVINVGAHEMGQGIRSAIAAIVDRKLGDPAERVRAEIGDTRGVPQHPTAGSWGTASVVPAASAAADAMLKALNDLSPSG